MLYRHRSKSNRKMFEWLFVSSFQSVIFRPVKKTLSLDKERMMLEIVDKNAFEIMTILNNLVLVCRL